MPTPTSLETPPSEKLAPADAIAAIGRGGFRPSDLTPLSDLDRDGARQFARAWPEFPEETRIGVVRALAELAEDNVELTFGRALRVALDDDSAVVRQLVVAALWEDEGRDLIDRFLHLLASDESMDVRSEAAQALARFADLAAVEDLDEATGDRLRSALLEAADGDLPYVVRRRALETVAGFGGDPRVMALIEGAYDDDDPGMRAGALYAMGRSLDARWLGAVLSEFESPDAEMRYEAARASGLLGDSQALEGLAELAGDRDDEVRAAAIRAIGQIGGPAAVNALHRLSARSRGAELDAIADALDDATTDVESMRMPT